MEQKQKKRKIDDGQNLIRLKNKYMKKLVKGAFDILQYNNINDNIITIENVAEQHKTRLVQTSKVYCYGSFPEPNLTFEMYESLISVVANDVMIQIQNELKDASYFSITIDSVPDTDQSAIYVRFVNKVGIPKKRFLDIINKKGDDALQLMNILHETLDKFGLDPLSFMGLSYNIGSNIPAYRAELRSCIKSINKFAEIVPCSSDPLSLVVIKAVSSCPEGDAFFTTIDELFNFFLFFEYRWYDIEFLLKDLPKSCFSSKNQIYRHLNKNWSMIIYALFHISENKSFPRKISIKANNLLEKVKRLETCFITMFWEDIIGQITELEGNLLKRVSTEINFHETFIIYESLISYLNNFRSNEKFIDYKTRASTKSNILHFNNNSFSEKPQMRFLVDDIDEDDKFKIYTYFFMIDKIQTELEYRKEIYLDLSSKFKLLDNISTMTDVQLVDEFKNLQRTFKYTTNHISDEYNKLRNILNKTRTGITSILYISRIISEQPFKNYFPLLEMITKMALCISATNCQVEHSSMSVLSKVITSLKSTNFINEHTYNTLIHINMDQELIKNYDFKYVIKELARKELVLNYLN